MHTADREAAARIRYTLMTLNAAVAAADYPVVRLTSIPRVDAPIGTVQHLHWDGDESEHPGITRALDDLNAALLDGFTRELLAVLTITRTGISSPETALVVADRIFRRGGGEY